MHAGPVSVIHRPTLVLVEAAAWLCTSQEAPRNAIAIPPCPEKTYAFARRSAMRSAAWPSQSGGGAGVAAGWRAV